MLSNTPLYRATIRDLKRGETQYKIKKTTKMVEIFTTHANRRLEIPAPLRFLLDREIICADQTPGLLNLDVNSKIDCCLPQEGPVSEDVQPLPTKISNRRGQPMESLRTAKNNGPRKHPEQGPLSSFRDLLHPRTHFLAHTKKRRVPKSESSGTALPLSCT